MSAPIEEIQLAKTAEVAPNVVEKTSSSRNSTSAVDEKLSQPVRTSYPGLTGFFHWHEPGTSKEEKRLIFKLDWFLLSYSCLCFFVKWLDSNNVTNAYASGMKEELGFGPGNELTWMNTFFNAGQLIGAPFANLIITVIRPRYWLPSCLLCWSLFVLFLYKCNTAHQFYALRFCIGLFESAAWPGIEYTLGSWYRKSEIARRSALFVISGVLGQMFSGYLQSALYSGMNGRGGLSAWRWLFIFDFILAVPIAIYGMLCHPDTPHQSNAWYLNEWERNRAKERIEEEGRKPVGKLDWTVFKRVATSWQLYCFVIGYALWSLTVGSLVLQYFTLYLKQTGYFTIPQINNIPTAIGAVNFFTMIITGYVADKIGNRGPVCLAVGLILTVCYAILSAWDVPHGLKMVVFIACGTYGCFTPLLAGWCNETCGGDQQKRAFILGLMTSVGPAVQIPFQQLQFPSSQAPHFKSTHGWPSALAFVVLLTLWTGFGIPTIQKAMQKRVQTDEHQSEYEAET
ncbi:Uu.00g062350.m01.CDS01 [Anthostomella pinea]|uniref:Uu.00g062350.m01.CDS01 n=1 Tax=Anthostomella pinea TaxID=933095 RepID=A0AAI8YMX8_9PEZI|nr:Uu.00g062350.m01.CDS01 [Anthostomella pinea]